MSNTRGKSTVLPHIIPSSLSRHRKKPTIESLPNEILSLIFWKLQIGDLVQASQVCRRWRFVAGDNLLWKRFYGTFAGPITKEEDANTPIHELDSGHWKYLCLKRCKVKRDQVYLKKWKHPDSYTGLRQRPELTLSKVGTTFQLSFTNRQNLEQTISHSDVYWLVTSATVRWYDLVFPDVQSVQSLKVFACSPIMFYSPTKPAKDGIVQKSMLTDLPGSLSRRLTGQCEPLGSDEHVTLHQLEPGLVVGLYQKDKEIAFMATFLHYHNLISRCLAGSATKCWLPKEVEGLEDDIDPQYGLHGYSCILILRNMRQKQLECKFTDLFTNKHKLAGGFASFQLVKKDDKMSHIVCLKELNFPWKTTLFKGIIQNVSVLDVTVLDERGEPFWTTVAAVKVHDSTHTGQFDFGSDAFQFVTYQDDTGKVELEIGKLEDGSQYVCNASLSLSLQAINTAFKTNYT